MARRKNIHYNEYYISKGENIMGNEHLRDLLEGDIEKALDEIADMDSGTDDHEKAVDSLVKMYKLKLEEDRLANEKADKLIERRLHITETVAKAGLCVGGVFIGYWFETEGAFTSQTFKRFTERIVPSLMKK